MAKISDLKWAYQVFMKAYSYRKVDWHPGAKEAALPGSGGASDDGGLLQAGPASIRHLHSWRRLLLSHHSERYRPECTQDRS